MIKKLSLIIIFVFLAISSTAMTQKIHHKITVSLNPDSHYLEAVDKIILPKNMNKSSLYFLLVKDLTVKCLTPGIRIKLDSSKIKAGDFGMDVEDFSQSSSISQNKYRIIFNKESEGKSAIILRFSGKIYYELKQMGGEYDRGFSQTPGLISNQGVYLSGSTYWVPWFNNDLITYDLQVSIPEPWDVVSHGKRTLHKKENKKRIIKWESKTPAEEIFVIAAKFHEYSVNTASAKVMAFLRTADENLANKYLETTVQYMEMYHKLIGPFPYSKFALVENFWETGYGMPSFTLLGPKIIRFPFILHSSYPHELLHNYWGNSVYVDFQKGNWCEGITVYMADHLIKEQRGQALSYRREKLQRYTDYVTPENDFPLAKFMSRNSASSEAIGYGKSMMFMEMLRDKFGDKLFVKSFQKFNRDNKFKAASFDDIRIAFEAVTGKDLKSFFNQWINRTGAPELKIVKVESKIEDNRYFLEFILEQIQNEDTFDLDIPIAISFKDEIVLKKIKMNKRKQSFEIAFNKQPLLLQIDPRYNLFRKLNHLEIPPSLSKIYGSKNILILLPSKAEKSMLDAYKGLSRKWSRNKTKTIEVKFDSELPSLPADKDIWILGERNLFKKVITKGISSYDAQVLPDAIKFRENTLQYNKHSFTVSVRHPNNPQRIVAWLTLEIPEAMDGIARKLMHYGKYSYLAFQGREVTNAAKGNWQAVNSPMLVEIVKNAKKTALTKLPKRRALAKLAPVFSSDLMIEHIKFLASDKLKGRGLGTAGIRTAANYIAGQFKKIGLAPGGDNGSYFQSFKTIVNAKGDKSEVKNIIGYIPGTNPEYKTESVVVSAHYDHLGLGWPDVRKGNAGKIHNGADDNASGIAVILELARLFNKTLKPARSVIFVAFTAEEAGLIGSNYYVNNYKLFPIQKVVGNINLDTVGRLYNKKLMVLNSSSAREWKFIFMGASYVTGIPSQMVSQQITASDQKSFIEKGVPGVQIFSGAHLDYHTPNDDSNRIDPAGLVKVAAFVREGILFLADTDKMLSFKGIKSNSANYSKKALPAKGSRRVSTGIMPDFGFNGAGVSIASVKEGSPAFKSGLKAGDIVVKIDQYQINSLREYANALKNFKPGDRVRFTYIRAKKTKTTALVLIER
jgi:hypothetical protein